MDKSALDAFNAFNNKGRPRTPLRPFHPQPGSSAADHREFADKLEAHEKALILHKEATVAYDTERTRLHDVVTDSMIAEYSNSGLNRQALQHILNHSLRETRTIEEGYEMYEGFIQLFRDVEKINKGAIAY